MNPKNIKLLSVIFLGLLVITLSPWIKDKIIPEKSSSDKFADVSVNFSEFNKKSVEKITINEKGKKVILSPNNGIWQINEKEISQAKVDLFFQSLENSKVQKQSSKNKENHSKFKVTQEDAITLTITSNGKDSVFFIGKNGPSLESFYARKKGVANVYLINGSLKSTLFTDQEEWEESEKTEETTAPPALEMP